MNLKKKTLEMKNWAVIGARIDKNTMGYKIPEVMKRKGYNVYSVNPKYESVDGEQFYSSILDIEVDIDCVDMIVNPKISIDLLEDIKEAGVKYVWFQPGTYNDEVLKKAEELGLEYVKDCIYAALRSL
jgi:uncharacterized protein